MTSLYIVVEGIDGSGKTTVARAISRRIQNATGSAPLELCEPQREDGTIGAEVRERLRTGPEPQQWEAIGLFTADRIQQLRTKLRPALEAGRVVVQDRSYVSTAVYNGDWRGTQRSVTHLLAVPVWPDAEVVLHHHHAFMPPPDLLVLLDLPGITAAGRVIQKALRSGERTHLPSDVRRLEEWRDRYRRLTRAHVGPRWWGRMVEIDASRPKRDVISAAWEAVRPLIQSPVGPGP